jgi:hypothetical protein
MWTGSNTTWGGREVFVFIMTRSYAIEKKCIYSTYSPPVLHTLMTSLTHQRKILSVVLQIRKAKDLSAPLHSKINVNVKRQGFRWPKQECSPDIHRDEENHEIPVKVIRQILTERKYNSTVRDMSCSLFKVNSEGYVTSSFRVEE